MSTAAKASINTYTSEPVIKKREQPGNGFTDNRPTFTTQSNLKQLVENSHQSGKLESIQRMADTTINSSGQIPIQLAEKTPTYSGTTKAENVNLQLNAGDHVKKGSKPSVDSAGYDNLRTIGLSASDNANGRKWVRFHALNEHSGGPGNNVANLTSTTALANHNAGWSAFETALKTAVPDNGGTTSAKVDFNVDISYPASATSTWEKDTDATKTQTTDAADYPNGITGRLDVGGTVTDVSLNAAKGAYGPEKFKKTPDWARHDSTGIKYTTTTDWEE